MAPDFWQGVEEASGVSSGYAKTGRVQPIADAQALELAKARAETARTLWQGHAIWEVVEAGDENWAPESPTGWLIRDTLSAHLHPRCACQAIAAALAAKGVLVTSEASQAAPTVWATGVSGLDKLTAGHHRLVGTGIKGQAAVLAHNAGSVPQLFTGGMHIIPHLDGTTAVGATTERTFQSPTDTDAQLDDLIARAREAVPALADAPVIERWAGLRPRSRSRAPMLGAWPGRAGHYIANGGFKIGFGMAPKVAQVMADLVLEGRDAIPEGFTVRDNL